LIAPPVKQSRVTLFQLGKTARKNFIMETQEQPIGYYLRTADKLLTDGIDRIQAEFELSRTDWQVMHAIAQTPGISKAALFEKMQSFVDMTGMEHVLRKLRIRDIVEGDEQYKLTDYGDDQHEDCLERQEEFRVHCMQGITSEEYRHVLSTLEKLINNLSSIQ
jgi:DNA-binding MarR family transcriptional regulator